MAVKTHRALFLDKDGTLIKDVPYNVDPSRITLEPGVGAALREIQRAGYKLILISNQSGVARGLFPETALDAVGLHISELLQPYAVTIQGFYYCPHHIDGLVPSYAVSCSCQKPLPGMLQRAALEHDIDLAQSWMVGDILNDIEAGRRAGCKTVLIDNGNETEWQEGQDRTPDYIVKSFRELPTIVCSQSTQKERSLHEV